jgi:hypothetical protein
MNQYFAASYGVFEPDHCWPVVEPPTRYRTPSTFRRLIDFSLVSDRKVQITS